MNPAGFPHSEILGSKLVYQLPEAYRSALLSFERPRLGAVFLPYGTCSRMHLEICIVTNC